MGLKVLPTLVGLSLWDCLALAFCTLIISQVFRLVKSFFYFFFGGNGEARPSKSRVWAESNRLAAFPKPLAVPIPLAFVPLLYHNLGDLSRGFSNFFSLLSDDFFKEV